MFLAFPLSIDDGHASTRPPAANSLLIAANVVLFFLGAPMPVSRGSGLLSTLGYAFSHANPFRRKPTRPGVTQAAAMLSSL